MIEKKKLLLLAVALTLFVNFQNYFKADIPKHKRTIDNLTLRIQNEQKLNEEQAQAVKELLGSNEQNLMFSKKKYSYSKAMGEFQNQIIKSAKGICAVKKTQWANSMDTKLWYERLRMSVILECKADQFFVFKNNMRDIGKLYNIENLRVVKQRKKPILTISMTIVAYLDKQDAR